MNKWGLLAPSLEEESAAARESLLMDAKVLTEQLVQLGYQPSITSGTLLGAVRDGDMLPHDDDIDLAILLEHSHPSDLSLASYRLEDELAELGHTIVRHSTAHLQVMFLREDGLIDHYIDIFTAFFRGDQFCQPFHIRQVVPRSAVVPTKTLQLSGIPFPAPAVPADWLAACYGPDWETPDPSFLFHTPLETKRRFDGWFGSQHANRPYWENKYARLERPVPLSDSDARHLRVFSRLLPSAAPVVDLGCGTGMLSSVIVSSAHDVIAVDYSYRALAIAREAGGSDVDLRFLNLHDRRRLLEFGAELVTTGRPWHFHLSHVMAGMTIEGRNDLFLFLRLMLTDDTFAFITEDTNYPRLHFDENNPETWHLPVDWLRAESEPHGLAVDVVETGSRPTPTGRRKTVSAVIRRDGRMMAPREESRS